ncbi:protein phosphatase CheZ [Cellvibrio zantedeschiae]|uniref:Protein phosphatase CheZ n=1 Tax=Cellvibrio zantedeschiae TaxID=1237077 RepID=A0ABQ3AU64_9GAMM|nr:protein phosphatase CheZ [Cellvibrio zantedeschiae]GGY67407.1 protein phosphatase CheZ [Cellvibrio zantedeschiae]
MASEILVDPNNELFIAELKECAKLLTEKLQGNQFEEASALIQSITESRDRHIFQTVGKLTRGLHNAIVNFNVDADLSKQPPKIEGSDIHDASNRLNYVIELTQKAAERTMDMVDEAAPIAANLGQEASLLRNDWARLKRREMSADEFRELYERMDGFLGQMEVGTERLNKSLQDIVLEQGFQDLTGQVLKRVIGLIKDVEKDLVDLVRMAGQVEEITGIVDNLDGEQNIDDLIEKRKHEAEGPQINKERENVVSGQDEVDDLLSSLGF